MSQKSECHTTLGRSQIDISQKIRHWPTDYWSRDTRPSGIWPRCNKTLAEFVWRKAWRHCDHWINDIMSLDARPLGQLAQHQTPQLCLNAAKRRLVKWHNASSLKPTFKMRKKVYDTMTNGQAALYKMPEFCQEDDAQIESLRRCNNWPIDSWSSNNIPTSWDHLNSQVEKDDSAISFK